MKFSIVAIIFVLLYVSGFSGGKDPARKRKSDLRKRDFLDDETGINRRFIIPEIHYYYCKKSHVRKCIREQYKKRPKKKG